MKLQTVWAFKGIDEANETMPIVMDYFNKKLLASLGYRFNDDELEQWQVDAYSIIANKVSDLEMKEMANKSRKR